MTPLGSGAGSTFEMPCPKCKKVLTIYHRSFYGVGKKCPHCGYLFGPDYTKGMMK